MKFSEIFYGEQKIFGKFFKRSVKFKTMVESIAKKVKVEFIIHFNEGDLNPISQNVGKCSPQGSHKLIGFLRLYLA